jgi:SMI1 / KNR4 family (SUKH-1)
MANEFRFEDHADARKFTPVTDGTIAAFASKYGFKFSADYIAFLKAHNGFEFNQLKRARPLAPGIETFDYVRYLFGIDTGFEYNDLRKHLAIPGVWDKPFRAFAYPIGDGPGGNQIIQVFKGKAKGRIYVVDHELFPDPDEIEEDDGIDIGAVSADKALAYMTDDRECFLEAAESFSDFLGRLVVYDGDGTVNVSIRGPLSSGWSW